MSEKLQKIIAASGLMSRRAAEKLIQEGRVSVNGITASLGDRAEDSDNITVDGRSLPSAGARTYIMLNKPKGYVCTLSDEKGRRNVTELVSLPGERLYPVGRLDMYSEGLLLMTNDGDFANFLMHPSNEFVKTYRTWVQGDDIKAAVIRLSWPMEIDGVEVCADTVEMERSYPDGAVLLISIHEGRNRQVRKMCAQAGLKVTKLLRISEGPLALGELAPGKWRELTEDELALIYET